MDDLTFSERAALDALLAGDHPALEALRRQLAASTVSTREFSGVGYFTHFRVAADAPRLPVRHWVIQDVEVEADGVENGGGALLFVVDGMLSMLEVYTYASEDWPREPRGFRTCYTTRDARTENGWVAKRTDSRDRTWLEEEYAEATRRAAAG